MFKLLGFNATVPSPHTIPPGQSHFPGATSVWGGRLGWSKHLSAGDVSRIKSAHTLKARSIRRDRKNFYHRMRSSPWKWNSWSYDGPGWKAAPYRLFMLSEHQQYSEADALKPTATSPLIAVGKAELQTFTLFSCYFLEYSLPPQNLKVQGCVEHIKYLYNSNLLDQWMSLHK